MESPKGKCTHEGCEFEIYKDDLCILHCEKTGKETEEEVSQFHETLLRYSVRDILNNPVIMGKVSENDLMSYLHNPRDFYLGHTFLYLYNLFSRISIKFYNIKFPEKYNHNDLDVFENKSFNYCKFLGSIFVYEGFSSDRKVESFYGCEFHSGVFVLNIKFDHRNEMINRNRKQTLSNYQQVLGDVNLNNVGRVNDLIYFSKDNLQFKYCYFNNVLWIENSNINSSFLISNNLIHELFINKCSFMEGYELTELITNKINSFKLYDSLFYIPFIFNKMKINIFLVKNSIFKGNLDLSNSSFDEIYLINSKFEDNCYISDIKFNSMENKYCLFNINKCYFNKIVNFGGSNLIGGLKIERTFFLSEVNFKDCEINDNKTNRETYRLIKNSLDKNGDIIEANKYFVEEMKAYNREISWKKNPAEKILLHFNEIISNFGSSYIIPLLLIIITMIIYSIIVFEFDHRYMEDISNLPLYKESIFSCNLWNNIAKNFSYFNFKLKPGMEFISLLFYIFWGICTWHLIVAVKRHTKR
ncbi:hypothetical protein [Actinobacillus delphinicola]|uniref:Pentapeptide repeat-containing protein n=1 Tax=Actinobacillus delphinicola TaxID=51161 RepID=A0A448TV76_9PAST|nr:hypothetical protein [Actinobacillus delphinicola]VEJ09841.1 Uncharacterised protein [Actinobacillus delphinicola]